MKRSLAVFLAFTCLGASALGADAKPAKPAAPAFDWSGFYAGIFAGYGHGEAASRNSADSVTSFESRGGLIGATVGANTQVGKFVLGAEGEIAWSDVNGSSSCADNAAFACLGRLDYFGTAKARAGVSLGNILVFATGGATVGGLDASIDPGAPGLTGSYSTAAWGWTAGAGVEFALFEAMSVKGEYNYLDFGAQEAPAGTLATDPVDLTAKVHTVKLGLNRHF